MVNSFKLKMNFPNWMNRTMENLAKSVDTSWELFPSKLSIDGTPLEDEDAGNQHDWFMDLINSIRFNEPFYWTAF